MEKKFRRGKEMLADAFDLPAEVVLDYPKITVTGNKQITIENHKGIISFEKELILINSKVGKIAVEGKDFEILYIGGATMSVSGTFKGINFQEKEV